MPREFTMLGNGSGTPTEVRQSDTFRRQFRPLPGATGQPSCGFEIERYYTPELITVTSDWTPSGVTFPPDIEWGTFSAPGLTIAPESVYSESKSINFLIDFTETANTSLPATYNEWILPPILQHWSDKFALLDTWLTGNIWHDEYFGNAFTGVVNSVVPLVGVEGKVDHLSVDLDDFETLGSGTFPVMSIAYAALCVNGVLASPILSLPLALTDSVFTGDSGNGTAQTFGARSVPIADGDSFGIAIWPKMRVRTNRGVGDDAIYQPGLGSSDYFGRTTAGLPSRGLFSFGGLSGVQRGVVTGAKRPSRMKTLGTPITLEWTNEPGSGTGYDPLFVGDSDETELRFHDWPSGLGGWSATGSHCNRLAIDSSAENSLTRVDLRFEHERPLLIINNLRSYLFVGDEAAVYPVFQMIVDAHANNGYNHDVAKQTAWSPRKVSKFKAAYNAGVQAGTYGWPQEITVTIG